MVSAPIPRNIYLQLVNSVVPHVVNSRHKPPCGPLLPSTRTLCPNSSHRYKNKGFAFHIGQFLSPLFSHSCAHLRLQPLCFDMLHKNTQGEEVPPSPTLPSRIGTRGAPRHVSAQSSLAPLSLLAGDLRRGFIPRSRVTGGRVAHHKGHRLRWRQDGGNSREE